jgi:hypothetical protein
MCGVLSQKLGEILPFIILKYLVVVVMLLFGLWFGADKVDFCTCQTLSILSARIELGNSVLLEVPSLF